MHHIFFFNTSKPLLNIVKALQTNEQNQRQSMLPVGVTLLQETYFGVEEHGLLLGVNEYVRHAEERIQLPKSFVSND